MHVVDSIKLVPDINRGMNWEEQDTGSIFTGQFSQRNGVEFQIFAPPGRYIQWHLPKHKTSHIHLNIKMVTDSSKNSGNGCSAYEIDLNQNSQNSYQKRATFYAGRDEDLKGHFVGDHLLRFSKNSMELKINAYEVEMITDHATSCFKALRVFVPYDRKKYATTIFLNRHP